MDAALNSKRFIKRKSMLLQISTLVLSLFSIPLVSAAKNESAVAQIIDTNKAQFSQCITDKKQAAREAGVSESRIESEFGNFSFVPRVIELDRSQPEFVSTFPSYFSKRVKKPSAKTPSSNKREFVPMVIMPISVLST